jgi:hypothetical protein
MIITYGHFYDFLDKKLSAHKSLDKLKPFDITKIFCEDNHINFSKLHKTLNGFGAYNDIEVLANVSPFISDDTSILKDLETPEEYAIRNKYYTKFHEGMWVRCKEGDIGYMPDLNMAYMKMFNSKRRPR